MRDRVDLLWISIPFLAKNRSVGRYKHCIFGGANNNLMKYVLLLRDIPNVAATMWPIIQLFINVYISVVTFVVLHSEADKIQ